MATVLLAVAATLVVAVLVALVIALQLRVRRLDAEVAKLRSATTARPADQRSPAPQRTPLPPEPPIEDAVAVITAVRAEGGRDTAGASLGRVVSVTAVGSAIKVAAFAHGVRRALDEEHRVQIAYAFRKELRRQRKAQRARPARRAGGAGRWP